MNKQKLLQILSSNVDVSKLSQTEIDAKCTEIETAYNKVLSTLTPREEKVIRLRYGFDDGTPKSLEELSKEFDIPREHIRQIEAKAIRKLKHPSRSKILNGIFNK